MYLANGFCRFGAKCKYSHPSLARGADSNASGTDQPIGLTTLACGPTGQPVQKSGLILATWQEELPTDCPNCSFLLQGIADGFNIVDIDKISTPVETDIYPSATGVAADKVEKQIITELENGQYKIVDKKTIVASALGAIPKKDSNKVRLIHDASRPDGLTLNDFITKDKFSYQSLQDAVDLIKPGIFMAKADLANAYRLVKIHLSNYMATGLKWRFSGHQHASYIVDTRLPYGSSKSPELFNQQYGGRWPYGAMTSSLTWMIS